MNRGKNSVSSTDRDVSTYELFERYWVVGETTRELPTSNIENQGIPIRSRGDTEAFQRGEVELEELWEEYLTDFQISLAQELRRLRFMEMTGEIE